MSLMLSTTMPRRNTLAANKNKPTSRVRVTRSPRWSSEPMRTPTASIVEAVSVETVDEVVTLAIREPPMKAYTITGTMQVYKPIWTGMLATVAYAIASGMTTAPVLRPARTSARSHLA